jgi:F-type H+-transporting ATPase subunit b
MDISNTLSNIGFDWQVALANLASFLIIFYLLKRFAFGPIGKILEERRRRVEQGLEDARRASTDRMMAEQEFEKRVTDAKHDANRIIASARTQEESILSKAAAKAEIEARSILRDADSKISEERAQMERELRERSANLIVKGVEKIIRQELSHEKNDELIKRALA